jgi:hypothetical protein
MGHRGRSGGDRRDRSGTGRWVVASLATWRLAHLVTQEDGPFEAVVRLRAAAGDGQLGELLDCFYCASVWIAFPLSLTVARGRELPLSALALSGAACLLERATEAPPGEPAPT